MRVPPGNRIPPEVRRAVLRYLSERLDAPMISTAEAVQTVREKIPMYVVPDRDLEDLIAEAAIEAGFDISFDGSRTLQ